MRAVLDTNVLLSGLLWRGAPNALVEQVRAGVVTLVTSPALLTELFEVIEREKFRAVLARSSKPPQQAIRELLLLAEIVDAPSLAVPVSRDPDDDAVLAAAVTAGADLIVSGDADLLALGEYSGISIVGPARAVNLVRR